MVRLPWGWAAGVITQISNLRDWKRCPSLNNGTGNFGGLKGVFFKKQGILGQNREFDLGTRVGSHSKIRGQVTPTSRRPHLRHAPTLPHDRSTARPGRCPSSRHCWRPRAFHPAAQPLIGRPLPISPGGTPHSLPPGEAGAQYLLGNVLFVMAITYVGNALPIVYCYQIDGRRSCEAAASRS